MSGSEGGRGSFDERERRALGVAMRRLADVPTLGRPELLLEGIAACVPVAAALLHVSNTASPGAVSGHVMRVPMDLVEAWIRTPEAHAARAFAHVVSAADGDFWRADALAPGLRAKLPVLDQIDRHGLGEGAGYKVLERPAPIAGVEQVSLALLTERRQTFPPRTARLLKALGPSVKAALLRLSLPIVASRPILAQILEEESTGYVVVTKTGAIVEINRRAHEISRLYHALARVPAGRHVVQGFVAQGLSHLSREDVWYLRRGSAILEVRRHFLRAAVHHIPEDVRLLTLREVSVSAAESTLVLPPDVDLTRRQREIAELLVRTGLTYEGIGQRLGIGSGTVRALVPRIYRACGVRSRTDLVERLGPTEE